MKQTSKLSEVTQLCCQNQSHYENIREGFHLKNKLFKKSRHYQLLRDFGELSFINVFIPNHWKLNTYTI